MKYLILVAVFFTLLFSINSCNCKRVKSADVSEKGNRKEVVNIQINRLEKDLFSMNLDSIAFFVPMFKAKYGELFDIFNYKMVKLGSSDEPGYPDLLKKFITDYYQNLNYTKVIQEYPNLDDLAKELSIAFTNVKTDFPKQELPRIFSCISGWNLSVATTDTLVAICLDMYLGRDCEFYSNLGIEKYLRYALQREYIVPDCMRAWGRTKFEFNDSAYNLLNKMLYEGKVQYFVKKMLPETADSVIFGYTSAQLKWCNNNEKQMWMYIVEHKLLFSTNYMTIQKLTGPAPFTYYFSNESPGRACVWLGYKIVEAYMANNKVTLEQLMHDADYQKILHQSKFKP